MSFPASGASAYAEISDFLARVDMRTVSQLLSDTTVPLTPAQVADSAKLTTLLMAASGEVEAACTVGQRYLINLQADPPINDLASLTGNSQQYLIDIVCYLALGRLFNRRPDRKSEEPKCCETAREELLALRKGEQVFGLIENQSAGQLGETIDPPAVVRARLSPVIIANRFFGRRANQYQQQNFGTGS